MITFSAPAVRCLPAASRVRNAAGGLDDHLHPELRPGQLLRILLRQDGYLGSVDGDGSVGRADLAGEATVDGVVAQEGSQRRRVGHVVDGNDLDVGPALVRRAQERPSDAAEAVYGDAGGHLPSPCRGQGHDRTTPWRTCHQGQPRADRGKAAIGGPCPPQRLDGGRWIWEVPPDRLTFDVPEPSGDMAPAEEGSRLSEPELRRLLDVGRTLVAQLDLEPVLDTVLGTARELTGARYAAIGVLDDKKDELERFLFVGIDEEERRRIGPLPRGHGVLGELIRRPAPLRLHDVTAHPRSYGFPPAHPPMKTFLGVPIRIRDEVYGNLYLTDKENGADFDERDLESTVVLADWAAIAIENAGLYTRLRSRHADLERAVRGLEATAVIAHAVGAETDLERVLELVAKRGRALADARSLVVVLERKGKMKVAAAAGEAGESLLGQDVASADTVAGIALSEGATQRIADLASRVGHGLGKLAEGATAALVAPLRFRAGTRGVLVAFDRLSGGPAFDAEDEHTFSSYAASAAIAIATAQSVEDDRHRNSVEASEQERRRWARELHDETLQELGALRVLLQGARQSGRPNAVTEAVDQAVDQIQVSISGLQSLITELRPAALDELGVGPALNALINRTAATSGLEIRARVGLAQERGRGAPRLAPEVETAVYRIVQESLTNVIKHAAADHVEIDVVEDAGRVTITVRDDGQGFDPAERGEGFGLLGMRERVSLVGGELLVESAGAAGTTVSASLPALRAEPAAADASVARKRA